MFAFTKTQKQRKLLIQLDLSYYDLLSDIDTYKSTTSDADFERDIKLSKFRLELLKISEYFSELKSTYPDFQTLDSHKDAWKLRKPTQSEGTLFLANVPIGDIHTYNMHVTTSNAYSSAIGTAHTKQLTQIHQASLAPHIEKALIAKANQKRLDAAIAKCKQYSIRATSHTEDIAILLEICEHLDNNSIQYVGPHIPHAMLYTIAAKTNTNIILEV